MSSVELVEIINSMREDGAAELRHDHFMVKIEKHPGIQSPKFLGDYKDSRGRMQKCYNLPKREAELMVMSESLEVQARVYDRLSALEARATLSRTTETEATAALSFWDAAVKSLNIAPSGHLGGVRAIAASYGYDALLPHLPVYAIDAAPTTATSAPTSSMPTASLTVLLGEHDIGVSAVTANKMLARAGILEEMTRPSSKGAVKKFWSVTDAGQKYGKNVTSPSNPKETQPHWYRDTFRELVRLHMVAW
jgi:hypothetical protein